MEPDGKLGRSARKAGQRLRWRAAALLILALSLLGWALVAGIIWLLWR